MLDFLSNQWLWTAVLGGALFMPTRRLLWAMSVNREARKTGQPVNEARRQALRRRATFTAALLCFVFSVLYVHVIMTRTFGRP